MIISNRILVVEDNKVMNSLITTYLEQYGFLPDAACTYNEAKKLLQREFYDLVTLDGDLDGGKIGFDLLPFIDKNTKVLLVSGRPDSELYETTQKYEKINDFLPKVFKGEDLVIKVRALLDVW